MASDVNASIFPPNDSEYRILTNEQQSFIEPNGLKIFRFIMYALIILFALVGNVAVCVITRRNRRLQTSTYFLVMNLAVSDIGSVLCLPFLLPELFVQSWRMGEVICKLVKPSVVVFNFVTTNTLVAIACDRFRAVVFPLVPRPSTSETRLILCLLWLVAFLFSLPLYGAMTLYSFDDEPYNYYCLDMFSYDGEKDILYRHVYTIVLYIVHVSLPVLVISVLYLKITATLKDIRLLPLVLRPNQSSSLTSTPSASPHSSTLHLNKLNMNSTGFMKRQAMENKFLKMLMSVLLVYILCYLPFQTLYLVSQFHYELYGLPYMQL